MDNFAQWLIARMKPLHHEQDAVGAISHLWSFIHFRNPTFKSREFSVFYIKQRVDTEFLRARFDTSFIPILFVVDSSLVNPKSINQEWLKALHSLYYGRIYVWDGKGILAAHVDKRTGNLMDNGYVEFKHVRFSKVEPWYRGFRGVFEIAMFDDRVYWDTTQQKPPPREKKPPEGEQFWREQYAQQSHNNPNHSQKSNDFDYEAFKRAYNHYRQQTGSGDTQEQTYDAPWAKQRPRGDKWFEMMVEGGTLEAAKKVRSKLALQYHPDYNKAPNATQIMQQINLAYEQVEAYYA